MLLELRDLGATSFTQFTAGFSGKRRSDRDFKSTKYHFTYDAKLRSCQSVLCNLKRHKEQGGRGECETEGDGRKWSKRRS